MRVLVIVAHPDDEVLGMGGTIKKLTKNGDDVKIVILATGITSRRSVNYQNNTRYEMNKKLIVEIEKQIKKLQNNARLAGKILGVNNIELLDFPDNEMDTVSQLKIIKKIESIIQDFKPKKVYTHTKDDVNVDHRSIYNAVLVATRPKSKNTIEEVIAFEVPSSTEWYFPSTFSPNIFVDISKELPSKKKALQAYKNEIRTFPHPRSVKAIDVTARKWGTVSGFKAAEAFSLIRKFQL